LALNFLIFTSFVSPSGETTEEAARKRNQRVKEKSSFLIQFPSQKDGWLSAGGEVKSQKRKVKPILYHWH
jgi:hypothetical protein